MKAPKHKHMTHEDRITIETSLTNNESLKDIAKCIGKDPTTISKEIKRNRVELLPTSFNHEPGYLDLIPICEKTKRFPHVCNACPKRRSCRLIKYYYKAADAQHEYLYNLSDSRKGYDISLVSLNEMANILEPLIKQGQSFHHIKTNNPSISLSTSTLYNYTNDGLFNFRNIDLPKKVRYKPRRKNTYKLPKEAKVGRLYSDYLSYCESEDITHTVQIDTVEGLKTDSQCLLTILFLPSRLMLIRLLPKQNAQCVTKAFNTLNEELGTEIFQELFKVILTDNGSEFNDILGLEYNPGTGEKRTALFYCDPMRSNQKGALEKNHVFIRSILPKKASFENLTHEKVKLIEDHINNYARISLQNKTPYMVFKFTYGVHICRMLSINELHPNEVVLTPSLIK